MMGKTESLEAIKDDDGLAVRLLQRIACEDRGAMDHFYGIHEAGIYRLALGILDDAQGATRVLVNVMLAAWHDAAALAAEGNVRAALLTLAQREARAWAAARGDSWAASPDILQLTDQEPGALLDRVTPGDFGLDQIWSALDVQRRARRRRRVLRHFASVKRTVSEWLEAWRFRLGPRELGDS